MNCQPFRGEISSKVGYFEDQSGGASRGQAPRRRPSGRGTGRYSRGNDRNAGDRTTGDRYPSERSASDRYSNDRSANERNTDDRTPVDRSEADDKSRTYVTVGFAMARLSIDAGISFRRAWARSRICLSGRRGRVAGAIPARTGAASIGTAALGKSKRRFCIICFGTVAALSL